jgi:hypothetical protein
MNVTIDSIREPFIVYPLMLNLLEIPIGSSIRIVAKRLCNHFYLSFIAQFIFVGSTGHHNPTVFTIIHDIHTDLPVGHKKGDKTPHNDQDKAAVYHPDPGIP